MVEVIKSDKTDIVLTVPHKRVFKTSVRPFRLVIDEEPGCDEIARAVAAAIPVCVVINDTTTDVNKPEADYILDEDKKRHKEFFEKIAELKPSLVIDLHGMANVGTLFNNAKIDGCRFFRYHEEKKAIGPRPDIDLQWGRKSGYTTAGHKVILAIAKRMVKLGLVVDFEAVYSGGNVAKLVSGFTTQSFSVEVSKRIRENTNGKRKVAQSLMDFIREVRGEVVEDELAEQDFQNTDEQWDALEREFEQSTGMRSDGRQLRPRNDTPGGFA